MKPVLILLMLLVASAPAIANHEPSFIQQLHNCTNLAVGYTEFAMYAEQAKESDHATFIAFVQQIAQDNREPYKSLIIMLGQKAWAHKAKDDVHEQAMSVFDQCASHLGTKI